LAKLKAKPRVRQKCHPFDTFAIERSGEEFPLIPTPTPSPQWIGADYRADFGA
jgi:hypothetical protein